MTKILTQAHRWHVLQVSDRLVVRGTPPHTPYDYFANKTIILSAKNGLVTMSYTGDAFVGKTPTDQMDRGADHRLEVGSPEHALPSPTVQSVHPK